MVTKADHFDRFEQHYRRHLTPINANTFHKAQNVYEVSKLPITRHESRGWRIITTESLVCLWICDVKWGHSPGVFCRSNGSAIIIHTKEPATLD